jgi:hypothetical protein
VEAAVSDCTCGSGAHPRHCLTHPEAYDRHIETLTKESLYDDNARLEAENDSLRARIDSIHDELSREKRAHDNARSENASLRARVSQLADAIAYARSSINDDVWGAPVRERLQAALDGQEAGEAAQLRERIAALEAKEALSAASWRSAEEECHRLRAEAVLLRIAKDGAYSERNACVAFMCKMAHQLGWTAFRGLHDEADTAWERDWRHIVFILTPTGQLSWHIHDSELPLFAWLPRADGNHWDGHVTAEKYERMREWNPARADLKGDGT